LNSTAASLLVAPYVVAAEVIELLPNQVTGLDDGVEMPEPSPTLLLLLVTAAPLLLLLQVGRVGVLLLLHHLHQR
jgi:hypothetical protein